ncbi:MAG TPA: hypothetical protein VF585_02325 [Chthoniobacterales bacterium]|jgi:hypothetical protein
MASNEIPTSYTDVVALGEDAADGAQTHGVAIGLKQNTEAAIRADLASLIAAENTVALKRTAKTTANGVHKTADSNGKAFIARFIQFEKPRFGDEWGHSGRKPGLPEDLLATQHAGRSVHPHRETGEVSAKQPDVRCD